MGRATDRGRRRRRRGRLAATLLISTTTLALTTPAIAQELLELPETTGLEDGVDSFDDVIRVTGSQAVPVTPATESPVGATPPDGPRIVGVGSAYFSPNVAGFDRPTLAIDYPLAFFHEPDDQAFFEVAVGFVAHAMIVDGLDLSLGWSQLEYSETATFVTRAGQPPLEGTPGIDNDPGVGTTEASSLLNEQGRTQTLFALPEGLFANPYYVIVTPLGGDRIQITHVMNDPTAPARFVLSWANQRTGPEDIGFQAVDQPAVGFDAPFNDTDDYTELGMRWSENWLLDFPPMETGDGDDAAIAGGDDTDTGDVAAPPEDGAADDAPTGDEAVESDEQAAETEPPGPDTGDDSDPPAEASSTPSPGTIIAILAAGGIVLMIIFWWLRNRSESNIAPTASTPRPPADPADGWRLGDDDDLDDFYDEHWGFWVNEWIDSVPADDDWRVWVNDGEFRIGSKSDPFAYPPPPPPEPGDPRLPPPLVVPPVVEDHDTLGSGMTPPEPDPDVLEGAKDDPDEYEDPPPIDESEPPWWGDGPPPMGPRDQTGNPATGANAAAAAVPAGPTANLDIVTPAAQEDKDAMLRIQGIAMKYRGTGDIAGVAEELWEFDQWYRSTKTLPGGWFSWTNDDGEGTLVDADDVNEFVTAREMSCYEFVHLCAWLASDWPVIQSRDANGVVTKERPRWGIAGDVINKGAETAVTGNVPRGEVIIGSKDTVNTFGYTHIVISLGGGDVIGLGGWGFNKEPLSEAMGSGYHKDEFFHGPYGYRNIRPVPVNPSPSAVVR